jgi:DNA adenine methylase
VNENVDRIRVSSGTAVTGQKACISNTADLLVPLRPLFKWYGGKGNEIIKLKQQIPERYDTYIEPFVGGGALYFHLAPKKAVINDIHPELIDFYKCIKDGKAREIHDFMKKHPNNERTYYSVRKMDTEDILERACRFYYLRKTCFGGMLRYNTKGEFNTSYGHNKVINFDSLLNNRYQTLLKNTVIKNVSFEHIFNKYNGKNNFMYLDPPSDCDFTDHGYCQFGKDKHERLAKLFKTTKNKCLMVIGETEFTKNLYNGYIADEFDKKYESKQHRGKERKIKHLVIKNYK